MIRQAARFSDWHLHTHLSDGFASPAETLAEAARLGLRQVSITDHDCLDAHRDARLRRQARQAGLELISGVEIDCTLGTLHLEILGYGFDPEDERLIERLERVQIARRERIRVLADRFRAAGEALDPAAIYPPETVAPLKVHLFRALENAGRVYADGYREFKAHIASLGPVPPLPIPTAAEAVERIHAAGGCALIAHPLYYLRTMTAEELLKAARAAGCEGIEFGYPYDYGDQGVPADQVRSGLARLKAALPVSFPAGARLTLGSDVHDPAEWRGRLECAEGWERAIGEARR